MVGLYFSYRQTTHVVEALRVNLNSRITTNTLDLDRVFIEKHHLREYFYEGKEIPDNHSDFHLALAIAELKLDIFEHNMLTYRDIDRVLPRDEHSNAWRQGNDEWIEFSFSNSPILCKYLEARKAWYTKELYDAMKAAMQKKNKGGQQE